MDLKRPPSPNAHDGSEKKIKRAKKVTVFKRKIKLWGDFNGVLK